MSEYKTASKSIHISDAPFVTHPKSLIFPPESHVVLPSHKSMWSGASITYAVIASLMVLSFWWASVNPTDSSASEDSSAVDDGILRTLLFVGYLLFGFSITAMFSYHDQPMYSWLMVIGLLTPAMIVLFWSVYRYQQFDDKESQS